MADELSAFNMDLPDDQAIMMSDILQAAEMAGIHLGDTDADRLESWRSPLLSIWVAVYFPLTRSESINFVIENPVEVNVTVGLMPLSPTGASLMRQEVRHGFIGRSDFDR